MFDEDDAPDEDAFLPLGERVEKEIAKAKELWFPKSLAELTGQPELQQFKLVNREFITRNNIVCGAGHKHNEVAIVETYRPVKDGETVAEPALSLDDALEQFRVAAAVEPAGNLGLSNETSIGPGLGQARDGLKKVFALHAAYETEASIKLAEAISLVEALQEESAHEAGGPSSPGPFG